MTQNAALLAIINNDTNSPEKLAALNALILANHVTPVNYRQLLREAVKANEAFWAGETHPVVFAAYKEDDDSWLQWNDNSSFETLKKAAAVKYCKLKLMALNGTEANFDAELLNIINANDQDAIRAALVANDEIKTLLGIKLDDSQDWASNNENVISNNQSLIIQKVAVTALFNKKLNTVVNSKSLDDYQLMALKKLLEVNLNQQNSLKDALNADVGALPQRKVYDILDFPNNFVDKIESVRGHGFLKTEIKEHLANCAGRAIKHHIAAGNYDNLNNVKLLALVNGTVEDTFKNAANNIAGLAIANGLMPNDEAFRMAIRKEAAAKILKNNINGLDNSGGKDAQRIALIALARHVENKKDFRKALKHGSAAAALIGLGGGNNEVIKKLFEGDEGDVLHEELAKLIAQKAYTLAIQDSRDPGLLGQMAKVDLSNANNFKHLEMKLFINPRVGQMFGGNTHVDLREVAKGLTTDQHKALKETAARTHLELLTKSEADNGLVSENINDEQAAILKMLSVSPDQRTFENHVKDKYYTEVGKLFESTNFVTMQENARKKFIEYRLIPKNQSNSQAYIDLAKETHSDAFKAKVASLVFNHDNVGAVDLDFIDDLYRDKVQGEIVKNNIEQVLMTQRTTGDDKETLQDYAVRMLVLANFPQNNGLDLFKTHLETYDGIDNSITVYIDDEQRKHLQRVAFHHYVEAKFEASPPNTTTSQTDLAGSKEVLEWIAAKVDGDFTGMNVLDAAKIKAALGTDSANFLANANYSAAADQPLGEEIRKLAGHQALLCAMKEKVLSQPGAVEAHLNKLIEALNGNPPQNNVDFDAAAAGLAVADNTRDLLKLSLLKPNKVDSAQKEIILQQVNAAKLQLTLTTAIAPKGAFHDSVFAEYAKLNKELQGTIFNKIKGYGNPDEIADNKVIKALTSSTNEVVVKAALKALGFPKENVSDEFVKNIVADNKKKALYSEIRNSAVAKILFDCGIDIQLDPAKVDAINALLYQALHTEIPKTAIQLLGSDDDAVGNAHAQTYNIFIEAMAAAGVLNVGAVALKIAFGANAAVYAGQGLDNRNHIREIHNANQGLLEAIKDPNAQGKSYLSHLLKQPHDVRTVDIDNERALALGRLFAKAKNYDDFKASLPAGAETKNVRYDGPNDTVDLVYANLPEFLQKDKPSFISKGEFTRLRRQQAINDFTTAQPNDRAAKRSMLKASNAKGYCPNPIEADSSIKNRYEDFKKVVDIEHKLLPLVHGKKAQKEAKRQIPNLEADLRYISKVLQGVKARKALVDELLTENDDVVNAFYGIGDTEVNKAAKRTKEQEELESQIKVLEKAEKKIEQGLANAKIMAAGNLIAQDKDIIVRSFDKGQYKDTLAKHQGAGVTTSSLSQDPIIVGQRKEESIGYKVTKQLEQGDYQELEIPVGTDEQTGQKVYSFGITVAKKSGTEFIHSGMPAYNANDPTNDKQRCIYAMKMAHTYLETRIDDKPSTGYKKKIVINAKNPKDAEMLFLTYMHIGQNSKEFKYPPEAIIVRGCPGFDANKYYDRGIFNRLITKKDASDEFDKFDKIPESKSLLIRQKQMSSDAKAGNRGVGSEKGKEIKKMKEEIFEGRRAINTSKLFGKTPTIDLLERTDDQPSLKP